MNLKHTLICGMLAAMLASAGFIDVGCSHHTTEKTATPAAPAASSVDNAKSTSGGGIDPQDYIESHFTPYEEVGPIVVAVIAKAQKSIYVADYTFTDAAVAQALIERKRAGVEVHVILDRSESRAVKKEQPIIEEMESAGIEVVIGTSERGAIMHNKFVVIDDIIVESGSFNYTPNANDQCNEVDIIKSAKRAQLFRSIWNKMYAFMTTGERSAAPDADHPKRHRHRR